MAQINIEPTPRRSALPFVLGLLLVAAIALAVWFFMQRRGSADDGLETTPPASNTADTVIGMF